MGKNLKFYQLSTKSFIYRFEYSCVFSHFIMLPVSKIKVTVELVEEK